MGNQPGKLQQQNQSSRPKKNVHWKSAERPSAPGRPSLIPLSDQQPDVVNLRWDRPKTDGGSPVTGYIVEHRRMGSPHWVRATPTPVARCEASLSGLEPGWRYQFRVFAENIVGRSDPSELSDPLTVTLQRNAITVPRFIDELVDMQAVEDERIEFRVRVVGQPPPEINWFKDGYEIFSSRRTKILNDNDVSSLVIHQVALTDEGEIKCTATNRAGHVVTKSKLLVQAPPRIRLPRTYEDGLIVEADEVLRLKVGIAGQPPPLVTWLHEGEIVLNGGRFEILNTERNSLLKIDTVQRTDRGEYSVKAWNKLGEDVTSFLVTVTARPDPPGKVRLNMSFGKSATLSWTAPIDDGGCKIGNYIVEYFRIGWNVWLKAATTRSLSTTLNDLIEGSEYKFRVKAENPYGLSDPSEESDVLFIPDPKRGIIKPKSETKLAEIKSKPLPPRRKTLSPSRPQQDASTETRFSPMANRKFKPQLLDNDDLHHEMSYGTPDQVLKMDARRSPSFTGNDSTAIEPNKSIKSLNQSITIANTTSTESRHKSPVMESTKKTQLFPPSSPLLQKLRLQQTSRESNLQENDTSSSRKGTPSPAGTRKTTFLRKSPTPPEPFKATPALQRSTEPVQLGFNQNVRRYSGHSLSPAKNVPSLAIAIATSNLGASTSNTSVEKQHASTITNPTIQISAPPPQPQQSLELPSLLLPTSPATSPLTTPDKPAPLNTSDRHDDVHTSNEFMLVVFDKNSKVKDKDKRNSFELDIEDALQPPPISISAPDLASLEFTNLHTTFPIRRSVSSTELLYERAMARFYEAVEYEEAEKMRKAQIVERETNLVPPGGGGGGTTQSTFIRKRLGSMTEAERLSFERRSEMRRLSVDFAHEFKTGPTKWGSRDNISTQIKTLSHSTKKFLQKESFESQELSDELSDELQAQHNSQLKVEESYEIASDYTESTAPSEEDSIEKFKMELMARTRSLSPQELETYHPRDMSAGIFTPYRAPTPDSAAVILNRPMPLPNPDFVPKPILKRPSKENVQPNNNETNENTNLNLSQSAEKSIDIKRGIKSFFKRDKRPSFDKAAAENEASNNIKEKSPSKLIQNNINSSVPHTPVNPVESEAVKRQVKAEEELRRKEAERITQEEAHAAVDHYSDLVRQVSTTRKYHTPLYLNPEELRKATERAAQEGGIIDNDEEIMRRKKSLTPEINLIPPINNKPRLSISEREQMVHVRETPSDLAVTSANKSTKSDMSSEKNRAQFGLEEEPPIQQPRRSASPQPRAMEMEIETEEPPMTTTTVISETTEERPDSRGRSRIVKVRRIVKKRTSSKSRDVSTNRVVPSEKLDATENDSNPPRISRRVLSRTRAPSGNSHSPGPYGRLTASTLTKNQDFETVVQPTPPTPPTQSSPSPPPSPISTSQDEIRETKTAEQLTEDAHEKVRSALSYSTDLVLFVVACYVYLFKDARLVLPILALMIYRQLGEAIAAYIPNWMKRKKN